VKVLYHVTEKSDLQDILTQGLVPKLGPRSIEAGESNPAIFLFPDIEDMDNALMNWMGECWDEDDDTELVALEITLDDNFPLVQTAGWEYMSLNPIEPSCIRYYKDV
jgi:hypothetical protein